MSSLIQAFFIEPVVRRARKISGLDDAPKPAPALDPHPLSHASRPDGPPRRQQRQDSLPLRNPQPGNRLGHALFDRFAPLVPASFGRPDAVGVRSDAVRLVLPAGGDGDEFDPSAVSLPASPTSSTTSRSSFESGDCPATDPTMSSSPPVRTPERRRSRERSLPQTTSPRLSRTNSSAGRMSRAHSRRNHFALAERSDAKNGHLPADDGMQSLRQHIQEIRQLAISAEEKAKRMHDLMTKDWAAHQASLRPRSADSVETAVSSVAALTLTSDGADSPAPSTSTIAISNPYNLHPDDLKPTYCPIDSPDSPNDSPPPSPDSHDSEPELARGCAHYKRNVKIQCFDCKKWYPCRHCHDEAEPGHALNRRKTENMLCMLCLTPQPAGQNCKECSKKAAHYYCEICKLWDDDATKRIYHCMDCGICRRGEGLGKDFAHCKKCNVCISIAFASHHRCIERATDCDCPICSDYMFTSPKDIVAMPCGHYMHQKCYTDYMAREYRCPICKKSATNMELQWRKLESAIEGQPMPAQWRDVRAEVRCNDCGSKSTGRYHWLGNKCHNCDGFNTNEVRLIGADESARRDAEEYVEGERRVAARSRNASLERTSTALPTPAPQEPRARAQLLRPTDYFASNFDDGPRRPSASAGDDTSSGMGLNLPNPYEMLARMSRSLSPIRHLFDEHITGERGRSRPPAEGDATHTPSPEDLLRPRSADAALLTPSGLDTPSQHVRSRSWAIAGRVAAWSEGWSLFSSEEEEGSEDGWESDSEAGGEGYEEEDWESSGDEGFSLRGHR